MAQAPEDMLREKHAEAVVEFTLIGALLGGLFACASGVAAGLVGAVGAKLAGRPDDLAWALGGAAGAALGALLPARVLWGPRRPIIGTALWLAATTAAAAALNWHLGTRLDWPFFRWALAGVLIGAFLAPMHVPRRILIEGNVSVSGRGEVIVAAVSLLAFFVSLVNRGLPGVLVAGGVGGLLGGAFSAVMTQWVGGREMAEVFGSTLVVPTVILVLCGVGGVLGGWQAWDHSQRSSLPRNPE